MTLLASIQPILKYYIVYAPFLIIVSLVLWATYMFISNFSALRSAYLCTSLKNIVSGEVGKCFGSRLGSTCKSSDIGFTHGWCNDEDNYGPLRGTRTGPYAVKCRDWIWNKADCPPDNCSDLRGRTWGWCADKGVQRSMRGQPCGPYVGNCDTWIWNAKSCPTKCGSPTCQDDSCICTMVKARYVILKRDDDRNEYINVKQIEVYDTNGYKIKTNVRPKLWPQHKNAEKYGAKFIVSGTGLAHTGKNKEAYMQLDLGEDKPIGRIVISNRVDCCTDRMIGCALVLRKDGGSTALYRKITEAKQVYDFTIGKSKGLPAAAPVPVKPVAAPPVAPVVPPVAAPPHVAPAAPPQPVKDPSKTGRYVTITRGSAGSFLNIGEIEVFGADNKKYTDIKASLSPPYNNNEFPASKLVDGKPNTFAHTENRAGAFMKLDLGSDKIIKRIDITNRRDGWQDRIKSAIVKITKEDGSIVYTSTLTTIKGVYSLPI
jgi:hypothetical protein